MMDASLAARLIYDNTERSITRTVGSAAALSAADDARMNAVAADFEAMFVSQMLEQMFGDSVGDDAFGDPETTQVYKGLMIEAYGKKIADSGGIGIADYVKKTLLSLQEI